MRGLVVLALRDEARCLGLVLSAGASHQVDVLEEQLAHVQEAIDRGDIAVDGMPAAAPALEESPAPKGKRK